MIIINYDNVYLLDMHADIYLATFIFICVCVAQNNSGYLRGRFSTN